MNKSPLTTELGIDEAGRGSILGPLVIAGVIVNPETVKKLEQFGIQDSKLFGSSKKAKETRANLTKQISDLCPHKVIIANAEEVDFYVTEKSLNILEQEKARAIISTLEADQVVLDGLNLFKPLISKQVIAVNRADQCYTSVAAASILAKSNRDQLFEQLVQEYIEDFGEVKGGGYANMSTLKFVQWYLEKEKRLPPFYRKSYNWKYLKNKA